MPAKVLNINERGARLRVDSDDLASEDQVALCIRDHRYPGHVIWRDGDSAGIAFSSALPEAILSVIHPRLRRADKGKKKRFLMP